MGFVRVENYDQTKGYIGDEKFEAFKIKGGFYLFTRSVLSDIVLWLSKEDQVPSLEEGYRIVRDNGRDSALATPVRDINLFVEAAKRWYGKGRDLEKIMSDKNIKERLASLSKKV